MTRGLRIAAGLLGLAVIAFGAGLVELGVLLLCAVISIIAWEWSE